jgi:hypothetical protein
MGTLHNGLYYTDWEAKLLNKNNQKNSKQLSNDTKQIIISLAYTDSLTKDDILELSDILLTISKYKTPNKKKGL